MTTIAYRAGALAGDTLIVQGTTRSGLMEKVWKTKRGDICGAAGNFQTVMAFRQWTEGGMRQGFDAGSDDFEGLIVDKTGKISVIEGKGAQPTDIHAAFVALGTGRDMALGAMSVGATAHQALEACIQGDTNTGGNITLVKLDALIEAEEKAALIKAEQEAKVAEAAKVAVDAQAQAVNGKVIELHPGNDQEPAPSA